MAEYISRKTIIKQLREFGTPQTIIQQLRQFKATPHEWQKYAKVYPELDSKDRSQHHRMVQVAETSFEIIDDAAILINLRRGRVKAARERDEEQVDAVQQAIDGDDDECNPALKVLQRDFGVDTGDADYFGKPVTGLRCPECGVRALKVLGYPNGTGNAWCKKRAGGCGWVLTRAAKIKGFPKVDISPYLGTLRYLEKLMGTTGMAKIVRQMFYRAQNRDDKHPPFHPFELTDRQLAEQTNTSARLVSKTKSLLKKDHTSWIWIWREALNKTQIGIRPDRFLQACLDVTKSSVHEEKAKVATRQQQRQRREGR